MKCKKCQEYYDKYPLVEEDDLLEGKKMVHRLDEHCSSSPIECAFSSGEFSTDNWGCRTMSLLRDYSDDFFKYRDDFVNGSIGVLPVPEYKDLSGYVVMTWYKDRGRTGQAYIMDDDEEPRRLTLKEAEDLIEYMEKNNARNN